LPVVRGRALLVVLAVVFCVMLLGAVAAVRAGEAPGFAESIFQPPGPQKPVDSVLAVAPGDPMPDFDLPAIDGGRVRLADYLGKKKLVISFIPAAWTPVCSGQWPGYNIAREIFEAENAGLLGISVDNTPSLHAWVTQMGGVWFPVASDFWPHGGLAGKLGILRPEGVSERAIFIVDEKGIIRSIAVSDINVRPDLGELVRALRDVR
jgi:peroxiredoxin